MCIANPPISAGEQSIAGREQPGYAFRILYRSSSQAYNCLAAIAEAAGIDVGREADFTPHVLRHTVGTTLTRSGTDIIVVAEILGHSVETARRYALPSRADRQTAIERLTTDQ